MLRFTDKKNEHNNNNANNDLGSLRYLFFLFVISADSEKLKILYLHRYSNDKGVKIDALEIIGVALGDEKTLIESALMYWDASIDERYIC